MNSNNSDKVKNFFRKEGFYFVLFICLCVIATVAVFTINRNSTANKDNSVEENLSLNVEENTSLEPSESANNEKIQNAERVENASSNVTDNEVAEGETTDVSEVADVAESEDAAVMSGSENGIIFSLPLEATVSRSFGEMIEVKKTDEEQIIMTRRGVDLQAPVGSVVKCAAEGQVQEVGSNSEDGNYIVVAHANGLKTKYANLDPEVYVSEGDMFMSRRGENIYKRKDGRWEGRYIKFYDENGKAKYGYAYSRTYTEAYFFNTVCRSGF